MSKVFFIQWLVKSQVHESNGIPESFWLLSKYLLRFSLWPANKNK
jgi:hypothetical protein